MCDPGEGSYIDMRELVWTVAKVWMVLLVLFGLVVLGTVTAIGASLYLMWYTFPWA